MISTNRVKPILKWVRYGMAAAIVGGALFLTGKFVQSRTVAVSGKVVSASTKAPIADVLVAVESGMPNEEVGLGSYVKTGSDGKFVAKAKGRVSISIWKPGYAMNGIFAGDALSLPGREIVIELREMTATNWIPEHENREGFGVGEGFSFALGKIVDGDNPNADIALRRYPENENVTYIESRGDGGVIFQQYGDGVDFYNTPEAPPTGYGHRLAVEPDRLGVYYIRTRDGKHYAKVRLLAGFRQTSKGSDFSYHWLQWAYQPDGTRNLEIKPGRDFPFPLGEFGIKRESLEQ